MRSDGRFSRKTTVWITLAILFACSAIAGLSASAARAAGPQEAQTSLGDAARKVRAEKKNEPAPKTFTNENLPKTDAGISVVGQPVPATTEAKPAEKPATDATSAAPATPTLSPAQLALQHELDEAMKQQDRLEKEIDLAQRDYSLQEQQALQNPNFKTDRDAHAHLAELHQGIDDQKAELDKVKASITDIQKRLDALNKGPESGSK